MNTIHRKQQCFHWFLLFLSIAMYMPSDFWMESLVMKLTKFWMSGSLLDINLSMVGFLIMDLVICLAWSVQWAKNYVKDLESCYTKSQTTASEYCQNKLNFTKFAQRLQSPHVLSTMQHTWNSQPLGHRLCGCSDDLVFRYQLVHQSNV